MMYTALGIHVGATGAGSADLALGNMFVLDWKLVVRAEGQIGCAAVTISPCRRSEPMLTPMRILPQADTTGKHCQVLPNMMRYLSMHR